MKITCPGECETVLSITCPRLVKISFFSSAFKYSHSCAYSTQQPICFLLQISDFVGLRRHQIISTKSKKLNFSYPFRIRAIICIPITRVLTYQIPHPGKVLQKMSRLRNTKLSNRFDRIHQNRQNIFCCCWYPKLLESISDLLTFWGNETQIGLSPISHRTNIVLSQSKWILLTFDWSSLVYMPETLLTVFGRYPEPARKYERSHDTLSNQPSQHLK